VPRASSTVAGSSACQWDVANPFDSPRADAELLGDLGDDTVTLIVSLDGLEDHPDRSLTKLDWVSLAALAGSARSQMAEGLLRVLGGGRFEAHSAGTEATHVRSLAIRAVAELGIDIAGQESKTLERYRDQPFDYVITVCDDANESCPIFPNARTRMHWSLPDPSQATGTAAEQLAVDRRVRDELQRLIERELLLPES
jgi:arsenate reductase